MIQLILLGLFVSTNAYIIEDPQYPVLDQDYPPYSPVGSPVDLEQYEQLKNYEAVRNADIDVESQHVYEEELRQPGVKPNTSDSYLCTAFQQPNGKSIVSFEPLDSNHAAHHIILFVCDQPGVNSPVPAWDCGEMSNQGQPSEFLKAPPCKAASSPIWAWAHNAGDEKTQLPKDVGFQVGTSSKNQFIVLQVHYMSALKTEDFSGVKISFTDAPTPKVASTLLLVTGGEVAKQTRQNFEASCVIDEDVEMHPISFRVHTHRHGEVVSGWLVQEDESGKDEWQLIGQRSPQKPQIFEGVKNTSLVIRQGDVLASRCTIYNNENHKIEIGPTSEQEMCNFYLMYWTEGQALSDNVCYSPGPPVYSWKGTAGLNHIPSN